MNKKLNKDYLNLSNDHKKVKEEKEKLKSIIDEQNAAIFNFEKQLSSKTKMQKYPKNEDYDNKMKTGINFERKYELNNDDENYKYNYSSEKINKYKDYSYNENDNDNYVEENIYFRNYNKANKNKENEYEYKLPFNNTTRHKNKIYSGEGKNEKINCNYKYNIILDDEKINNINII